DGAWDSSHCEHCPGQPSGKVALAMSDTQQSTSNAQPRARPAPDESYDAPSRPEPTAWVGVVLFGGIMLLMVGGFQIIQGIVALFKEDYYPAPPNGPVLHIDYTAWGWTHLLIGRVAVVAAVGMMLGQMWARVTGIII